MEHHGEVVGWGGGAAGWLEQEGGPLGGVQVQASLGFSWLHSCKT